jgi:1,2-diacylglycerol 3-alpha-glucosyltransferase
MKIVMLCDLYDVRVSYQENLLAQYYAKNGHDVVVIAGPYDNAFDFVAEHPAQDLSRRELRDGLVRVFKLPYRINLLNRLRRFSGVTEILEREQPDLIFVHDIHFNLREAALYKRRHPETRVVMDYHADFSNSARNWLSLTVLHKGIRRPFFCRYRWAIDRIYPVVPKSAEFLHSVYRVPYAEMELLPLGSDVDLIKAVAARGARGTVRESLGIDPSDFVIVSGGKLTPSKKTHVLLEALLDLDLPGAHLLIVGESGREHADYLASLRARASGCPRVHFVGWREGEDLYASLLAGDLAVFPGSQSVMWQHALACGVPLIVGGGTHTSDQDPSYLNRHDNMIILPRHNVTVDELRVHLSAVIEDRVRLAQLTEGARRVGAEFLNYHRIVVQTLNA